MIKKHKTLSAFASALLLCSTLALNAASGQSLQNTTSPESSANDKVSFLNDQEYKKLLLEAKFATREIAQTDTIDYATEVADDLKNITSQLVGGTQWQNQKELKTPALPGVRTSEELAALIDKLEAEYANHSPMAQLVIAQLSSLKPFRGILFRLRPLAENQHTPAVHGLIISFLRGINAGINNLFPSDQWTAGFDYLTKPFPGVAPQIKSANQLKTFVQSAAIPEMLKLALRVKNLNLTKPVYFDNKIFWGKANFTSEHDRFKLIGETEKEVYLSSILYGMSSLYNAIAYDWTGLFKATQSFWVTYGFNTLANPDNMTAEQRIASINQYPKLFTLIPGGNVYTKMGFFRFKESLKFAKAAWERIKAENREKDFQAVTFFDPRGFSPFTRIIDTSFLDIEGLISDKGISSAVVNGETLTINFKKFSEEPPVNLKSFLATHFKNSNGPRDLVEPKTGLKYRDYSKGNPDGWNTSAYVKYFPNIDKDGVPKTIRILNQSWGGGILGFPLALVLF